MWTSDGCRSEDSLVAEKRCVCGTALTGRQKRWCSVGCSKEEARRKHLWVCFNITPDDYARILREQGGGCGICQREPKPGKSLAVDHDHQSGFVRGLLCFFCNKRVIGARNAEVLIKTAAYVSDPPATRALGRDVVAPGRPKKKRQPRKRPRK